MELRDHRPSRYDAPPLQDRHVIAVEATDVITVDQVLQAARLDVEYFRGCCHGIATGTVLGALVVGALCYFLG